MNPCDLWIHKPEVKKIFYTELVEVLIQDLINRKHEQ